MSQANLFDVPAPAAQPTSREGLALGDRVTWKAGHGGERTGRLVYIGPRLAFFGVSEFWLSRWEWEQFIKQTKLRRGDGWRNEEVNGELLITRDVSGWWAHGPGSRVEKATP